MKVSTVFYSLSTAAGAFAASAAHVFLLDASSPSHPATHDTIDPETAQLIFAQRLGLSSLYDLPTDAKTLSRLNAFGGRPQSLLRGNRHQDDPSRIFVVIEGVDSAVELMPTSEKAAFFDMSPAPHPDQTEELVHRIHGEMYQLNEDLYPAFSKREIASLGDHVHFSRGQAYIHVKSIKAVVDAHGRSSAEYTSHIAKVRSALQDLVSSIESPGSSLTIVMMPPEAESASRSEKTYRLIARAPNAARQPLEAPLSEGVSHVVSTVESTAAQQFSSLKSSNSSKPLPKGPIRPYFSSKSECEKTTNNCTGHGSCVVLFKDLEQKEDKQDVFGCACKPQVVKGLGGKDKTTRYAGGACSKKDVSQEFWLLFGTTIFLLFIVGFGMSMLYSMGNEELPSVLGAGVSGPRVSK